MYVCALPGAYDIGPSRYRPGASTGQEATPLALPAAAIPDPYDNVIIDKWAKLFKAKTWEEIRMIATKNKAIGEAAYTIYKISEDERIRQECEAREIFLQKEKAAKKKERKYKRTERELAKAKEQLAQKDDQLAQKDEQLAKQQKEIEELRRRLNEQ